MVERFRNRADAGRVLAGLLSQYANRDDVLVLALPRGGVPVGYVIAGALDVPLDVFLVRKLGVPGHQELAMGAIATGNVLVLNEEVIRTLGLLGVTSFAQLGQSFLRQATATNPPNVFSAFPLFDHEPYRY